MTPQPIPLRDVGLFLLVMLIWGLNFAVAKTGLQELPPILMMTLRFALVTLLLLPFVPRPSDHWRAVFLVSVTLGFLHFALMFTGLRGIDAATAAIAIQLQVPFASLLAAFVFGDQLGWRRALGMAIAFVGVAIIAGEPRLQGSLLSLALVVIAALIWAVSNIQVKRLHQLDGWTISAWMSAFAVPQLLAASLILEQGHLAALEGASWRAWGAVAYNAIAVMILGYGAWYWLLRRYQVNQVVPFTLLVPVIGVAAGVVLLGEPLTTALMVGGAMTVVGVGIITVRRPRTADPITERV